MSAEYIITKREKCTHCENGIVQHPAWTAFFEQFPSWPEIEAERAYWIERGYQRNLPPEEIPCGYCAGKGVIETEASLVEVLIELGVAITAVNAETQED